MFARTLLPLALLSAALTFAAPAGASVEQEARLGESVVRQLQAGTTSCDKLTAADFDHVGEFVIARMTGSVRLHEAMNDRMRSVLGADNEQRMHELMGRRYAGCAPPSGQGMGPAMMGGRGWSATSTWGPMMGTGAWAWMRDGNWQRMSQADWRRVGDQWMGSGMMRANDRDWSTAAVLVATFVALVLLGGIAVLLVVLRRSRHGSPI